jgi:hypothetical protein
MNQLLTNQAALEQLLGKRLAIWRRAADMLILHFGEVRREDDKSWGEYAFHVQCPWRLLKDGAMFTGFADLFQRKEKITGPEHVKWYKEGNWSYNLLEHRLLSILTSDSTPRSLENTTNGLVVEKVEATEINDAKLYLSGGYMWECFADGCRGEYWRLLDCEHENRKHFVVSGCLK